ncbi:MAG TPA: hypothetical protein VHV51_02355 [Polyangiaceae bacterium]|jgi:hypothetical protein|nr:hypothetical protein [Polyangiaceae bacterium]
MAQQSDRDEAGEGTSVEIGRRETLRLATLAAALGAGLSVSLHVDEASAAEGAQLQIKFYRQVKGEAQLVYTAALPEDAGKKMLEAPGLIQLKCYQQKEALVGASQMQLKIEQQKQPAPNKPATGWDIKQQKKT